MFTLIRCIMYETVLMPCIRPWYKITNNKEWTIMYKLAEVEDYGMAIIKNINCNNASLKFFVEFAFYLLEDKIKLIDTPLNNILYILDSSNIIANNMLVVL